MSGFEIVLDLLVISTLFLLVGRDRNAPQQIPAPAPTPEPEEATTETVEETIAALPAGSLAGSLPLSEVVQWVRPEFEALELALRAIAQVAAELPPHRPGGGRRAYQERLFADAWALQGRSRVSDAAVLTVAQVAVNALAEEEVAELPRGA